MKIVGQKIRYDKIRESNEINLLGVTFHSKCKFDSRIANCLKANQKLSVLKVDWQVC